MAKKPNHKRKLDHKPGAGQGGAASPQKSKAAPSTPIQAGDWISQAQAAFSRQSWAEVTELARQARRAGAGADKAAFDVLTALAAEAHFRTALAHLSRERLRAALNEVEKAVELAPQDPLYRYHLGLAHHRLGRFADAIAAYTVAYAQAEREKQQSLCWRAAYHCALAAVQSGQSGDEALWAEMRARLTAAAPARAHERAAVLRLESWRTACLAAPVGEDALAWQSARGLPAIIQAEKALFLLAAGDGAAALKALQKAVGIESQVLTFPDDWSFAHELVVLAALIYASVQRPRFNRLSGGMIAALEALTRRKAADDPLAARAATEAAEFANWCLWQAGWHAYQANRGEVARDLWRYADGFVRNQPPIWHNLALLAEQLELWDDAEEDWLAYARAMRPGGQAKGDPWGEMVAMQVYLRLCHQRMHDDDWAPPQEWLQAILRSPHLDSAERLDVAAMAEACGYPHLVRQALQPLRTALVNDEDLARQVARLYQRAEMHREAQSVWETVLAQSPADKEAAWALASLLVTEGERHLQEGGRNRLTAARTAFERAIQLEAGEARAWIGLAICHCLAGERTEAKQCTNKALAVEPDGDKLLELGAMFIKAGLLEQAKGLFKVVLTRDPNPRLRLAAGYTWAVNGQPELGAKELRRAFRALAYDPGICMATVAALRERQPELAAALANAVRRHHPNHYRTLTYEGYLAAQKNDVKTAVRCLKKALPLAKESGDEETAANIANVLRAIKQLTRLEWD